MHVLPQTPNYGAKSWDHRQMEMLPEGGASDSANVLSKLLAYN